MFVGDLERGAAAGDECGTESIDAGEPCGDEAVEFLRGDGEWLWLVWRGASEVSGEDGGGGACGEGCVAELEACERPYAVSEPVAELLAEWFVVVDAGFCGGHGGVELADGVGAPLEDDGDVLVLDEGAEPPCVLPVEDFESEMGD